MSHDKIIRGGDDSFNTLFIEMDAAKHGLRVVFLELELIAIMKFTLAPTTSSSILSGSSWAKKILTITMPMGTTTLTKRSLTLPWTKFESG